jgi:AmpE protein
MKLLVIVICILSERYLVHAASYYRFYWFDAYSNSITRRLPKNGFFNNSFVSLATLILPILLIVGIVLVLFNNVLFGFISLLFNLLIFYYCLGPGNPFYPVSSSDEDTESEAVAGRYFAKVNNQLFAVIFWFIVAGPLGALLYRLLHLSRGHELAKDAAELLSGYLDWICARITLLLYLLVGNFQQGFQYFRQMFLSSPQNNDEILETGGLLAARTSDVEVVTLPYAQNFVEHALIVYLVFLAFFTLVAWL